MDDREREKKKSNRKILIFKGDERESSKFLKVVDLIASYHHI